VFYGLVSVFGGTANNATLDSDGIMEVSSGIANNTVLNIHAAQFVSSGGTACSTVVNSGSWQTVSDGGKAELTIVNADGFHDVTSGGKTNSATVNSGGTLYVSSGGMAESATVNSGGKLYVTSGGTATMITADSDACLKLTVAPDTYIQGNSGGSAFLLENAFISAYTVNSGGALYVSSGGVADTAAVNSGGELYVYDGGKVTGCLEIASGAVVSAYTGGIIDFDVLNWSAVSPALINNLSLISGMPNYTITVDSEQTEGVYTLADGAEGFAQTVTICNASGICASLAVGGSVMLGDRDYALNLDAGLLTLTVSSGAPIPPTPAVGTAGDLNADGRADIVMTIDQAGHGADGSTGAWLIREDQTAEWGDLSTRNAGWTVFGTGKTAAGKNTYDVYITSKENVVGAWTTGEDGRVNGWETIGEFDAETQIVGLGDFNGDGQTDLLLRNNGTAGCFFTGGEKTGWNYFQSLGDEWKLSAIGDLNGDGRDDVVLKHDEGFAGSWLTQEDGTVAWADLDTLPDGFEIVGAGDFNGDGTDDVLLKTGTYYGAWLVEDGNAAGWFGIGDLGNVTVEQIADFNADGKDDLRIRTAAGDLGSLLVSGPDTLDWKYYGSVGSEWSTSLAALS